MDAGSVLLCGSAGRSLRVHAATLLADPATRIAGGGQEPPTAAGPLLDDLTGTELEQLAGRLGHVRELLTGYASGSAGTAAEGEPRPRYDPSLPVRDREGAKAAELGVSARTVRRWVAAFRQSGPAGLATPVNFEEPSKSLLARTQRHPKAVHTSSEQQNPELNDLHFLKSQA